MRLLCATCLFFFLKKASFENKCYHTSLKTEHLWRYTVRLFENNLFYTPISDNSLSRQRRTFSIFDDSVAYLTMETQIGSLAI